jgi:hypothetical protein
MTAGGRCRPETAVAGQTTVPRVRLQDTEDADRSRRAPPFTHAGGRAFGKPHRDGSAEVSTDGLHRLRRAARLRYYGQNYPSCAAWAQ